MSAGLPVLLSDHAAYKVHITHAKEGYYIPTLLANVNLNHSFYYCSNTEFASLYSQSLALDNTVLIQFLSELLSSPKKTLSMGKAARKKIESNHTLNHMFQRLMGFFTASFSFHFASCSLMKKKITIVDYGSGNLLLNNIVG